MTEVEVHNLAKWARDYLSAQTGLDELIRRAASGDNIANAALAILAKAKCGIVNGKYYTVSLSRAKDAIEKGINPPYHIRHQFEKSENDEVKVVTVSYYIDEEYNKVEESRIEQGLTTIEDEFLI